MLRVEETNSGTSIPENTYAKLMYYFQQMESMMHCRNEIRESERFLEGKYKSDYALKYDEKQRLYRVCKYFNPAMLEGKCLLRNAQLCGECNNKFFAVKSMGGAVNLGSIVVGSETHKFDQFMTYKDCWMEEFYIRPMRALWQEINLTEITMAAMVAGSGGAAGLDSKQCETS